MAFSYSFAVGDKISTDIVCSCGPSVVAELLVSKRPIICKYFIKLFETNGKINEKATEHAMCDRTIYCATVCRPCL